MNGIAHMIVAICFILGMSLIDLDHYNARCNTENMLKGFLGKDDYQRCGRGILHNPIILYCLIALTAGVALHLKMDGLI